MKLPESRYKTGVQSLGRESMAGPAATLAEGAAFAKALDITGEQIGEALQRHKKNKEDLEDHRARMHMVGVETNYNDAWGGKVDVAATEIPENIVIEGGRTVDVTNADGTTSQQVKRVPLYEFEPDMFKGTFSEGLEQAAQFISDPKRRAEFLRDGEFKIEQAYGKLVLQSAKDQEKYLTNKVKLDQEKMERSYRFDDAIDIIDTRTDLTDVEKEGERTRVYQDKELYGIDNILIDRKTTTDDVDAELARLMQPEGIRQSVLNQDQTLTAIAALQAKRRQITSKDKANRQEQERYWKGQVKGYVSYLEKSIKPDMSMGNRLKSTLREAGMFELLDEISYHEMNAHMYTEIRNTNPEGARVQFEMWREEAKMTDDYKFMGFLESNVRPVLEEHEERMRKDPRAYMEEMEVIERVPLDYGNAGRFAAAIDKRINQEDTITFMSGRKSPGPMSRSELSEFKSVWDSADMATQKRMMLAVTALGREKSEIFLNQIHSAGIPTSAYNVGQLQLRGRMDVANQLLEAEVLRKNKDAWRAAIPVGRQESQIYGEVIDKISGLYGPLQQEATHRTARDTVSLYVHRLNNGEDVSITGVLDDLVGERIKYKGNTILVPPGVPPKTYRRFLGSFTQYDIQEMGDPSGYSAGQLQSQVRSGVLKIYPYGIGQSVLYDPEQDRVVLNKDGSPFLFQYKRFGLIP